MEHLYYPGWEFRRKKRAEESSEGAGTSKRVCYNSESEGDRPARDRCTLQEREREDRDLNERKAREQRADHERSTNRERSLDRDDGRKQDSRKYDSRKGGGRGPRHNRAAPSQGAAPSQDPTNEVNL